MWTHMLICPDNHFSCLDKGYYKYISSHHHCYQPDIPKGDAELCKGKYFNYLGMCQLFSELKKYPLACNP